MKKFYQRLSIISLLIIFVTLIGYRDAKSGEGIKEPKIEPNPGIGIKAVNERLIARGVIHADSIWCGPGSMIAYKKYEEGIFLQDVKTGKVINVTDNAYNRMVGCTNDGKWFVYLDRGFSHKGTKDSPKVGYDIVRYEIETGRHQAFVTAYDAEAAFSPLDDSIYLGGPPAASREMPEPKWNIIWSGSEYGAQLRLRKSPVVISGWVDLVVEVLEPERRSFRVEIPGIENFTPELIDAQTGFT